MRRSLLICEHLAMVPMRRLVLVGFVASSLAGCTAKTAALDCSDVKSSDWIAIAFYEPPEVQRAGIEVSRDLLNTDYKIALAKERLARERGLPLSDYDRARIRELEAALAAPEPEIVPPPDPARVAKVQKCMSRVEPWQVPGPARVIIDGPVDIRIRR